MKSKKVSEKQSLTSSTPANVHKEVLPNGLTVVTEAMPSVRSVAIGIWLRGGSRQESKAENGITHFLEHMVFKGTSHRTAEEIARSADSIGGHLDAFTAKEFTSFSVKVLDEHVPRAFDVLADLVKNPLLREDHVEKESQVIQEEIKMVEDTPDDLVHEIFLANYWRGHSLGRPILGTRQTVGSLDRKRLLEYFHRYYTPKNMIIAAAGHLEHQRIVDIVGQEFGELPSGRSVPRDPAPVPHAVIGTHHKKNLEQAHICLGTPAYPHTHKKRYAAYVLSTVLGGGMSSRLFQKIREERGLVYAVFSGLSTFRDAGYLSVYAGASKQNVRQVVDLIVAELKELKTKPLPAEELQRAKDYLKGSMLLALESTGSRMSNLARQEIYFGKYTTIDEVARRVDSVKVDHVMQVACEVFDAKRLSLTVLGPPDGLKFTRAQLAC
ncbi:MAG TPA: pitrilysin family protein [Terriglobia bacterium]|nr:pitrilysin family protein [Terriglobia bacterium]